MKSDMLLVEIYIPILSLRFLAEVSLLFQIEELEKCIYENITHVIQKEISITEFCYVYNERSQQLLHPEQYLYDCDIAYGDCLLLI